MEMRIGMDEDTSRFKNENPCASCDYSCDGWDASYCCRLCAYLGTEHCESCDPMDLTNTKLLKHTQR